MNDITAQAVSDPASLFHTFDVVNKKTGRSMRLQQIGRTADEAAETIKAFNLAGCDFEKDYELRQLLTAERFDALPDGEIFATGEVVDSPDGVNMTGSGRMLRFVATKGHANDWAVYVHWSENDEAWIRENGDKVRGTENITRCVPCGDGVLGLYRY